MVALFHHNVTKSPACLTNVANLQKTINFSPAIGIRADRLLSRYGCLFKFSVEISWPLLPNSPCWKSRKAAVHALICMHTHAAFIFINIFGVCVHVRQSPQEDSFISSLKADMSILHHLFTPSFLSFRRVGQPSIFIFIIIIISLHLSFTDKHIYSCIFSFSWRFSHSFVCFIIQG